MVTNDMLVKTRLHKEHGHQQEEQQQQQQEQQQSRDAVTILFFW